MNEQRPSLNTREKYVVVLMFIIAACFLLLQVVSMISSRAKAVVVDDDTIRMSRNEILSFMRVVISIVLSFAGAVLLKKLKRSGWVISVAVLLLFTLILGAILYAIAITLQGEFDITMGLGAVGVMVLLLGIIFLFIPSTRKKFRAGRNGILAALLLFLLLGGMFFFLQ
jgi:hypothetical protein